MSRNHQTHYSEIVKSPDKTPIVRQMFARIAPRYDFLNHIMSLGLDLRWRRIAVRNADFAPGSTILDLGVGTGDFAREIVRHVENTTVVGLDNCNELMALGQKKEGLESVAWTQAIGQQLPVADNCVDGVIAGFSLRNMVDVPAVFQEVNRILRPGGAFVILDMVKPTSTFSYRIFHLHFKFIVPLLGKLFGADPDAYEYLLPSIENFYSLRQLKQSMKELGLRNVWGRTFMFQSVAVCIGRK